VALTEGLAALREALGGELRGDLAGQLMHTLGLRGDGGAARTRTRGQGNDAATRHQPGGNVKPIGGRIRPGPASIPGQVPAGATDTVEMPAIEVVEEVLPGGEPPRFPDRPDPSDAAAEVWALVERAQAGDAEAFGRIYDRYVDTVFRFVYFRVGNRQLAEDLTADTFLRALKRINSFTWQGRDLGAWLVTIARNLVADHFKSGRYRLEVTTGDVLDADTADRGPEGSPEAAVVDHITNVALLTAVKQLNPEQQECIVLRFLQGFSVAETAQAMGKNEGAIKALQYRAVRALARLLPAGFQA
jgi:RNA polymerase sigma-70 factor (ECF subfamily)